MAVEIPSGLSANEKNSHAQDPDSRPHQIGIPATRAWRTTARFRRVGFHALRQLLGVQVTARAINNMEFFRSLLFV
jgi:hypothetical protein